MNERNRSLLAAFLSLLVLAGWFFFFGQEPQPSSEGKSSPTVSPSPVPSAAPVTSTQLPMMEEKGSAGPETVKGLQTNLLEMEWTDRGGRLKKIFLKSYRADLLPFEGERGMTLVCDNCSRPLPDEGHTLAAESDRSLVYQSEGGGIFVQKAYAWNPDNYLLDLKVTLENRSQETFHGSPGLQWRARQFPEKPKGMLGFLKGPEDQRGFISNLGGKVSHEAGKDLAKEFRGVVPWSGIEDRYFLIALISRRLSSDQRLVLQRSGDRLDLSLYPMEVTLPPGGRYEETFSLYLGPKERNALQTAGVGLEKAIDYGWFSFFAIPILKLLQLFHSVINNWGVAIILLTIFVKLLMNPLTIKSMKQMKEMQRLQPRLAELKEKYKNDKQRLNQETMQLFKTHKVNPVGGCLPMLLQMPIYIALYKVLYNAIELYRAPFFLFYRDLSAPDPYFILPILLGVSMVAQQKLTPSTSVDPAQKQMMMIMPVMFTVFMLFLPLGLVLYIFVNTISSVLQQWMYTKDIGWRDLFSGRLKGQAPT